MLEENSGSARPGVEVIEGKWKGSSLRLGEGLAKGDTAAQNTEQGTCHNNTNPSSTGQQFSSPGHFEDHKSSQQHQKTIHLTSN
jgi:hypothetical protein